MFVVPGTANRLGAITLAVFLIIGAATPLQAEQKSADTDVESIAEQKLTILPTLRGHMARLGTLMNFLFRELDEPDKSRAVLVTIEEMKLHLTSVGESFLPTKISTTASLSERTDAIGGFKACVGGAIAMLDVIAKDVEAERLRDARESLLELDRLRRDCHSAYAD